MNKVKNLSVFHFGDDLNMMFNVVMGITKIKLDKDILFLNQRLNFGSNNKITTMDLNSIKNLNELNIQDKYSIVLIDSNIDENLLETISNEKYEEVAFIVCTKDKDGIDESKYMFVDFEELSSLPMFKKISKVNEIRKKLKANKVLKKFKFFQ